MSPHQVHRPRFAFEELSVHVAARILLARWAADIEIYLKRLGQFALLAVAKAVLGLA